VFLVIALACLFSTLRVYRLVTLRAFLLYRYFSRQVAQT